MLGLHIQRRREEERRGRIGFCLYWGLRWGAYDFANSFFIGEFEWELTEEGQNKCSLSDLSQQCISKTKET